jgi:hypothetical protein
MKEFRDIPGYEGLYSIASDGTIRSLGREGFANGRWGQAYVKFPPLTMKQSITTSGYRYIGLRKDNKSKKHLVHRLVLLTFVGPSSLQCNHKDGDKGNNNLSNLEYCTCAENIRHCMDVLGKKRGEMSGVSKVKLSDIANIRSDNRILREIAEDYGVTLQAIHNIKHRKTWKHVD